MFKRVLIANRAEVGARVARTARGMGVQTVAVVSEADRELSWLDGVDEVVQIGGPRPAESYLDQSAILEVARHTACSAVHPGWGFLSENAVFAERCAAAGISFIGPSPAHLRLMGDKVSARRALAALGVPVAPGSLEPVRDAREAREVGSRVGYPILLKAVAGGGGRGMRLVNDPGELDSVFGIASAEAASSFGDGRIYLERRLSRARHVEVQVVGDRYGGVVHLGERECSIQRRYQKVVEEGPSPALDAPAREALLRAATAVVRRLGYRGAGTLEFLVDEDGNAWFMEMNPRLQVEHGVSELLTGVDLVAWQLQVAANGALPLAQHQIERRGHAIEVRLNAEDPTMEFRPSPGKIVGLDLPVGEGIRVDTHLSRGDRVPPYYDSLVAKILTHGADRAQALRRMEGALAQVRVDGPVTNLGLLRQITQWPEFRTGDYHTGTLESLGVR
ncbi:MAG: ATP-grasp domain-containing protein [Deltaproteobacteria bacterium]|nr:ATP-grasp domain-containing protein [Deltaproteobacteria bacterium]